MFVKKILLLTVLLISITAVFAQVFEIKSTSNLENEPEWIQMMYQESADPELVEQAYEVYYQNHKLVKNIHTQYYKRWQRAMQRDVNGWFASGGTMTPAEVNTLQADYLAKTAALQMQRGPSSVWECVGPFDFDKESVSRSYASGSAHVYTVEQSISNTNILYAGTATAGVYKSIDKGLNWTLMTKGMIINGFRSIEIDYTNPDIVYFEAGGVLYKTTDGGINWLVIGDAAFQAVSHEVRDIVMHPSNAQSIFLCAKDGLYHTSDAGANWTKVLSGYFQELEFKPGDLNTIYAIKQIGNHTEFYKSTDGGVNWTIKPTGWPGVASSNQANFVSGGLNGSNTDYVQFASNADLGDASTPDFTIEMRIKTNGWSSDPAILSNKNWASGGNKGFIIAGNTNGTTWKFNMGDGTNRIDINGGTINDNTWHHIAVTYDANGTKKVYQDGSEIASSSTILTTNVNSLLNMAIGQDGSLSYSAGISMQVSELRVWSSVLSATTLNDWRCSALNNTHPDNVNLMHHWKFDENLGTTANDVAGTNNGSFVGNNTWIASNTMNCITSSLTGSDEQKRVEIAVSADEPNYVFALATGKDNGGSGLFGVYKSTDSGETWAFVCCGPQPAGVPSSSNPNLMAWSDQGTDDGGQYYYDLAFAVDPNDANKIHVGGVNHWVSTDGGVTFTCPAKWSHVDKVNYVHADIHDIHYYGSDLWFGCDGGIFYSNDGGATINRRQFGIAGTDFWGFGIGHSDAEIMLGGTYHNGTLLKDHNVYTNGWVCTGGGDNYRGFVNPGNPRLVYFDYGEKRLSGDRTVGYQDLSLNLQPNATYTVGKSSNIEFLPSNYHSFYLGNGTSIWKTTDDGATFTQVYDFGSKVAEIRLVGSNPNVIYCTTFDANKVWKSIDAGVSWTEITPNGTYRRYDIAVSNTDANKVWAIRLSNTGSTRVYYSSNGGTSWTNITGSNMSGESLTNIVCQQGTNGGVYIGTKRAVYYKNLSMGDFVLFNNGLPVSTYSVRLIPNYETGKLFNGTNRSVYKVDMYESSTPTAQISADKNELFCAGEQVQFASVSVASANASYSWSFAGGSPASSTSKTPLIQYNNTGTYNVTLSVSDVNGGDSQTLNGFIVVGSECDPEVVPGNAMICTASGDYANIPDLGLSTNTITFSAWVKPNGTQPDYSGIVFNDGTSAGLNFRSGKLAYHWPNGSYSWNSNLVVPENEWSHVAMVVTSTGVTLYLNGVGSTHNFTAGTVGFGTMKAGSYKGWGSRNFKGEMDEVCIYNRSLSADEIKDLMHLTKIPVNDASLIHYYQFNRMSGIITDRTGGLLHAAFAGGATRATSTAPVGGGTSHRMIVNSSGVKVFTGTDLTLEFPVGGTYPDGDLVVSRIDVAPDQTPGALPTPANRYWVISNYGNNSTFTPLTSLKFEGLSGIATINGGSEYKLHKRSSTADGSTWSGELDYADAATSTSLIFSTGNGISSFSQFAINKAAVVLPVELINFIVRRTAENSAILEWNTGTEVKSSHFEIERSKDGVNFSFFDKVISTGNVNEGSFYTIEDKNPYNGLTYYRLKQVDVDGSFTYSPIRSIVINALPEKIVVYPNPLTDSRLLKVQSVFQEDLKLELFDATGKQIQSVTIPQGNGEIDLKGLPQGTYFYRVTSDSFMKNGAIILE